jgi:hypothetical protein
MSRPWFFVENYFFAPRSQKILIENIFVGVPCRGHQFRLGDVTANELFFELIFNFYDTFLGITEALWDRRNRGGENQMREESEKLFYARTFITPENSN